MGIFFVIFVVVIILIIPLSIHQEKKTTEAWGRAAAKLGLHHRPGGLTKRRAIEGAKHGFRVRVDTFTRRSGKNSTTYTRIRVTYPRALRLGLALTREGFFSGVTKFFGAQDIEVGDAQFDSSTIVKGSNVAEIRRYLNPARRLRIHRFLQTYPGAQIRDNEIYMEQHGVIRDANALANQVQSFLRIAWYMCEDRPQDEVVTAALAAQDDGRPEEALRLLEEARTSRGAEVAEVVEVYPVDETVLEGEILQMANRRDEAKARFAEAQQASPDDPEIREWISQVSAPPLVRQGRYVRPSLEKKIEIPDPDADRRVQAPPVRVPPVQREPVVEDLPEVEAVSQTPPAYDGLIDDTAEEPSEEVSDGQFEADDGPFDGPIDVAEFCQDVFGENNASYQANAIFEEKYIGREVHWFGTLVRAEPFTYDMVFGSDDACRATVEIHKVQESSYWSHTVKAFIRLPKGEAESLRARVGQPISFAGQLFKLDALMRNVYVTAAVIE